jgi:hypothetical protein
MNAILAFALLLGASAPQQQTPPAPQPQAQPAPQPNPCDAPEFRHFDFWIGEWDVVGPKGQKAGSNIIEPLAGNCGIHENWTGIGGGLGRSLNTYDRADGKWHQVWVGNGGMILRLSGGLRDGKMVLEGTTTGPRGTMMHRITWTPMEDGRVRQYWESSTDGGATWNVAFDGYYSRKRKG